MCAVKNAVAKFPDEFHIVHALIAEVRGIVIETEAGMIFHGMKGAFGGSDVERDFGGMHLEGEVDVLFFEDVEDRQPAFGKIGKATFEESLIGGRKGIQRVPDG